MRVPSIIHFTRIFHEINHPASSLGVPPFETRSFLRANRQEVLSSSLHAACCQLQRDSFAEQNRSFGPRSGHVEDVERVFL